MKGYVNCKEVGHRFLISILASIAFFAVGIQPALYAEQQQQTHTGETQPLSSSAAVEGKDEIGARTGVYHSSKVRVTSSASAADQILPEPTPPIGPPPTANAEEIPIDTWGPAHTPGQFKRTEPVAPPVEPSLSGERKGNNNTLSPRR